MSKTKSFVLLTLASNDKSVIIPVDNIAFAMASEEVKEDETQGTKYARVFLKEIIIDDESKWVDVKEAPEQIAKMA